MVQPMTAQLPYPGSDQPFPTYPPQTAYPPPSPPLKRSPQLTQGSRSDALETGTILLVDDLPDNLHVLSAMLSSEGYEVRCIKTGSMALTSAKAMPPDLILLDVCMPGMSGYDLCELLKSSPDTCDIPIIFLSALDEALDKVKAFEVGGVDYITKPFKSEEVLVRVHHQLTIRQLQQQLHENNCQLQQEINTRLKTETTLKQLNDELEIRVEERAAQLKMINRQLHQKIEEHKQVKASFQSTQADYQRLIDTASEGVWTTDRQHTLILVTARMAELLGYSIPELEGKDLLSCVEPEDRDTVAPYLYQRNDIEVSRCVCQMRAQDGSERWVILSMQPVYTADGQWSGTFGTIADYTAQKRAELLLRDATMANEDLIDTVHRQIRSTLVAIMKLLDPQKRGIHEPEAAAQLDSSRHHVYALALILEQLCQTHQLSQVDLGEYLKDLMNRLLVTLPTKARIPRLEHHVIPVLMDIKMTFLCGLIITELVVNSLQ